MTGYFRVPKTDRYFFKLVAENLGIRLIIDGLAIIESFFPQEHVSSIQFIDLKEESIHRLEIVFFASPNRQHKGLSLKWKNDALQDFTTFEEVFYSSNSKFVYLFLEVRLVILS
jgi:hypothetical protein